MEYTQPTVNLIQTAVEYLIQWCNNTGLHISTKKSNIIKFISRKNSVSIPHISLKGNVLLVVEEHRSLGPTFDSKVGNNILDKPKSFV